MDNLSGIFHLKENKIVFQQATYIEDGWFIEVTQDDDEITLYQIPLGGGDPVKVGCYFNLFDAMADAQELT